MKLRILALVAALATALVLSSTTTYAQGSGAQETGKQEIGDRERAAIRQLGIEGARLYEAGDYAAALEHFQRAHELVGLTTSGLWTARCLAKVGRLVEAAERYLEATRMTLPANARKQHVTAQRDAEQERRELLPRIPRVTLRVVGAREGVMAQLDGTAVPSALLGVSQPVDPGDHTFTATAGQARAEQPFSVAEGEKRVVELKLEPGAAAPPRAGSPPAPAPQPPAPADPGDHPAQSASVQGTLGWVAIGLGGAGLVLGAVTGGLAVDRHGTLEEGCADGRCPPDLHDDVDSYDTLRPIATIGLIAGGVLVATGVTLVLTAPGEPASADQVSLRAFVTPELCGLAGTF
ncbi:MAG: tetratricopeptide repeat protein [Deltaproteobacteria bacterium]|nr:tetratricopeptide repeat protein [Deltaproteobacteria bacterium]